MERASGTRVLEGKGEKERSEDVRPNGKKQANSLVPTAFPTLFGSLLFGGVGCKARL